jgi:TonB-dependent SusC/RagA subfamily outer membrane receptor
MQCRGRRAGRAGLRSNAGAGRSGVLMRGQVESSFLNRQEKAAMASRSSRARGGARLVRSVTAGLLAAVLLLPVAAWAQTGSVTGTVRDRSTLQPLNGVQVTVEGTTRGGLTDARGRFLITGVPAGQVTVQAVFIGYRTEQRRAAVTAGEAAVVDIELNVAAVSLEEVIVTGTAGAVERRQLGATVASVDVGRVQETVPVADVGSVLQARIPGVRSLATVGGVGASRDLRIRGTSSFSLGQRPVVYIDGVRVDTRQTEWGTTLGSCCAFSGGAGEDRLSDLNPADIERIEVIKGPAAGTLYGSEGSNGVIQIFTKRGRSDSAPRWTVGITTGFERYRENFQTKMWPRFTGPDGFRALDANKTLIENGPYQGYDVTVQGGGNSVTYFVSGGYVDHQGSVQPNWQRRGNLRLNLSWLPTERLSFDVTSAFTRSRIASLQSGNNWTALLGNAVLGNPTQATAQRPYGEPWVTVEAIKAIETFDDTNRWTGGITLNYNPVDNWTHKLQFGLDEVNEEKIRYMPWGYAYVYVPEGEKALGYRNARQVTFDYLSTLRFGITDDIGSQLSFGTQGFWDTERRNFAVGRGFAGPGVSTVPAGTFTAGTEDFTETIQVGFYGQNRFSILDKLFITTGLRADGNSAFGDNYGFQLYPNVQASYDLTREAFIPSALTQLRVRAALGTSGLAPGAFDKFTTYQAFTVLDDQPGVRVDRAGNDDLRPERTTEIEGGFEVGFLNDRVGLEFTAYRASTRDALVEIETPPSARFGTQYRSNIGGLVNRGWEATLRVTPIEARAFRWQTDLRFDGNKSEVTDLGMDQQADTAILRRGNIFVGYPVRHLRGQVIVDYNPATNRHTRSDTAHYIGPTLPTFNASLGNEITWRNLRLYGLVTMEKGAWFNNSDRPYRIRFRTGDEYLSTLDFSRCRPDGRCIESEMRTPKSDSLFNYYNLVSAFDKRDNIRLREVSLIYSVPRNLTDRFGLGNTTVTLSGQNLYWWDDCNCMDPNMTYLGGASFGEAAGFLAMPTPRQFRLALRTSF